MRAKTAEDHRLLDLLDPVAEAAGFAIVRLRMMGGDRARRLQIMAERADGTMLVEDCSALARAISQVLDAADPISGEYLLEVSSPGVDRPLTRIEDFAAYVGFEARLEIDRLDEGRKRFKGVIAGVEPDDGPKAVPGGDHSDAHKSDRAMVRLEADGESPAVTLPFDWIVEAKLTVTDALMARGAAARAARLALQQQTPALPEEASR